MARGTLSLLMIGDDYFELRARIGADLRALAATWGETGGSAEHAALIEQLMEGLREPLVLVVVGEAKVGKSVFLKALLGQDFTRADALPSTDKARHFRHGAASQIVPVTPALDEVQAPVDLLRDFHIVDLPGAGSNGDEHQPIIERFVPVADLVICVFSAMNPWSASAWQFLAKIQGEPMRRVILVLQQCDLRSPEEIQVITDYMGPLTRQRFGREFPLFAVSAQNAFLARSSGRDRERLMQDSGFHLLEERLSECLRRNAARQQTLIHTVRLARQILDPLCEHFVAARGMAQNQEAVMQNLQTERQLQVERTLKKILPILDAMEHDYHDAVLGVAALAGELLAIRRAFQRQPAAEEESTAERPKSLDHRLLQELQRRTGDRWRQASLVLEEDVHQFGRLLETHSGGLFSPAERPDDPDGGELRRRFVTRVDSVLRRFVIGLNLDEHIEPGLERARRIARWASWLIPPILLTTGVCWWLDGPMGAGMAAGAGTLLLLAIYLLTQMRLNRVRNTILHTLEESSARLRDLLSTQVTEEVTGLFTGFIEVLNPAQARAAQQAQEQSAHVARLWRLAESFEGLEQQCLALTLMPLQT